MEITYKTLFLNKEIEGNSFRFVTKKNKIVFDS